MLVADYAEGKEGVLPPVELDYALQAQRYPGALPNPGGLRNQPYNLMLKMRVYMNVYTAFKQYTNSGLSMKWIENNPESWSIIGIVTQMRHDLGKETRTFTDEKISADSDLANERVPMRSTRIVRKVGQDQEVQ